MAFACHHHKVLAEQWAERESGIRLAVDAGPYREIQAAVSDKRQKDWQESLDDPNARAAKLLMEPRDRLRRHQDRSSGADPERHCSGGIVSCLRQFLLCLAQFRLRDSRSRKKHAAGWWRDDTMRSALPELRG